MFTDHERQRNPAEQFVAFVVGLASEAWEMYVLLTSIDPGTDGTTFS